MIFGTAGPGVARQGGAWQGAVWHGMGLFMTTRVAQPAITPAQRKALFAAARGKGLSTDDLRAMTPRGSISALSRREAFDLLNRLNAGTEYDRPAPHRRPRRARGMYAFVTQAQRDLIVSLRLEIGWSDDQFRDWLGKRHYRDDPTRPMTDMQSSADAERVIELLKGVRERMEQAQAKREEAGDAIPLRF